MGLGPEIGILTNAFKDHLDRYDSFEHYLWAKELIFQEQNESQLSIFNGDQEISDEIAARVSSNKQYWFSQKILPDGKNGVYREGDNLVRRIDGKETPFAHVHDIKIEGEHNIANALAASLAAHLAGVSDDDIHVSLKEFNGLPGRQEILGEVEGVVFVNDTNSTSPEAVMAALKRFGNGGNIVLITGGDAKGFTFQEVGKMIGEECKYVVILEGGAAGDIEKAIRDGAPSVRADSMEKAVKNAMENSTLGNIVLLSPGASSFALFKNEFDRGDQFKAGFEKIVKKSKRSQKK